MRAITRVSLAGLAVVLFTFSLFLMRSQTSSAPDFQSVESVQGLEEKTIEIPKGATGSQIASILFEAGIVKSSQAYFRVAVGDSRSEKVAPGSHRLTLRISGTTSFGAVIRPRTYSKI
jgi:UPF0755 protein